MDSAQRDKGTNELLYVQMGLPVNEGGIKRDWRKIENLKLDILSFLVSTLVHLGMLVVSLTDISPPWELSRSACVLLLRFVYVIDY